MPPATTVLAKLGAATRGEAAAIARRDALLPWTDPGWWTSRLSGALLAAGLPWQ
ncbi:MAG: hypothetical protein LCH82_15610 [Actinobacteria bacterium]|nr:hypothetical protein [Actinomycetota bacterium]